MQPRNDRPPAVSPKYDAIHRALLTGLLANVGTKGEGHEYSGARGSKFHIFPGSSLFGKKPQWVMAAEVVETSKLYARTVAKTQPEWIERAAEHLVKRSYSDPRWNADTQHVVAYEKVTLYGLSIIPQRTVHYGPIDPKVSREIFIHALTEGEFRTDAQFLRHNAKLVDEIQTLEAKARNRDVLVDHIIRYDFYHSRIPAGIFNGPLFEKWRKEAERRNPRLLHMTRKDLMQHAASGVTQELFPDHLAIGGVALPLEYHLEVGHPADGVTVTIPLPALNQLPAPRFEWLVPGMLKEKVTALIKSLPKQTRVNFVPAPDVADEAVAKLKPGDGSLHEALALFLSQRGGAVRVSPTDFDPAALLDHLHMNFRVVDESGKQLAMGRDLNEIRRRLGVAVKSTFEQTTHPQFTRDNLRTWDFGDLPESVPVRRHGMNLMGYPALMENGSGVSLRLLDSAPAAAAAHAAGLRKLLTIDLRDEIAYSAKNIPKIQQMCLWFATLGTCQELRDDIVGETINRTFLFDANVRTQMEYELRREAGRRHRLLEVGREVADLAERILREYHAVALTLARPSIPAFAPAITDMKGQVARLMPKAFLSTTPDEWLVHFPRYLKGIHLRLQKLVSAGHTRDAQFLSEIQSLEKQYVERLQHHRQHNLFDPTIHQYRWMLEELRISFFAQELKTALPVSVKRMEKLWETVKK